MKNSAVLFLAFGGPESLDDVKPFVMNVLASRGRTPAQAQIDGIIERYKLIGGKSPLLEITRSQAVALEKISSEAGNPVKVYTGMRHWHPFIKDTLDEIWNDGVEKVLALPLAPHNSKAVIGGYVEAVEKALNGRETHVDVSYVKSWHTHPLFLEALKEKIVEALSGFSTEDRATVQLIFSVHSLPLRLVQNDPYVEQVMETIDGVLKLMDQTERPIQWHLAYQSKGGGPGEWLGPDIESVLKTLAERGDKNVLLVPVGFVSDHVEILYDIDILAKEAAESLGINFRRTLSLNDSSKFIEALFTIVSENLQS
ncbi:MAG: ferrochelatase [Thermodesulfobacteriota bacterium]